MSSADDSARLAAAGLDPDDVSARFHEWAHAEYGEDSVYDHTYECSDLEAAYAAGYAARHVESPDLFGPPGTGTTVGIAVEVDSDALGAFLGRVPDVQGDTVGRALVNIARYLPEGIRVRLRATYRADDETRSRGRVQVPGG